ncbi:uncharacterized protein LOC110847853 [Folsomia candida]|uniref:Secreted protein n=1 Tax=Folsomia candida TaxID=158441 RepID=A0A226EN08_FOLCA|nr:uncharacterized protein LOC110847853 [Folsomia candida]OXA58507.1 hypothetical protein Fcan01_08536 [Folsomia candida]
MDKCSSSLVIVIVAAYFVAAATTVMTHPNGPATIDPTLDSDLFGPIVIRRNRASHPRQQDVLPAGEDDVGTELVRSERNLLNGLLPLPTASLITELLLSLNNLLAKLDVTVVLLPAPFPMRLAKCVPGCLRNADCRDATTSSAHQDVGSPISAVLGLLGKLGGV